MPAADWIFTNARIHTMDANNRIVTAAAVSNGHILAVGDESAMTAHRTAATRVRDMAGQTIIPAFLDPHGHFPDSGLCALRCVDLSGPPLGECTRLNDIFDRLHDKIMQTAAGEFVFGVFFDQIRMREKRFPTRDELDTLSRVHPIWIMHLSFHAGAGNSAALASAGISRHTPQPTGGFIEKDSTTGEPTGLLKEPAAMGPLAEYMTNTDSASFREGMRWATAEYFSQGVTTAQSAWANAALLSEIATADADGDLSIRLVVLPDAALEPALSNGQPRIHGSDSLRLGPRKLFSDGSIQIHTAYLSRPYHTPYHNNAAYAGYPTHPRDNLCAHICRLHEAGHQIHIHANGDAAADDVLVGFSQALQQCPRVDHRHTIIHGQTLREDQLDTMQALDLSVSFFSFHAYVWGDQHHDIFLGPARAARINPTRSAAQHGIRFTIHNDTPVSPIRPLSLIWSAVNRLTESGRILGAAQRLTPLEALRAHTIDAAWQVFMEDELGSVETGKKADFAVLSADPLIVAPAALRDIQVLETIHNGRTVFTKDSQN